MPRSMKDVLETAYRGRTVLLTGHTGFKGAWLNEWLMALGARVVGYSLDPASRPSLFELLRQEGRVHAHLHADVRDVDRLRSAVAAHRPDFVFHFAAQTLVGVGYEDPLGTYQTNVMGTLNVLEALRDVSWPCAAVLITTDKVYENVEWEHGYRETDPLGGYDPYSASKACCEIAISSYRRSFFNVDEDPSVAVASCRAGNVIGGGDWAADRIVPDCMRSLAQGLPIPVRNQHASRAWQHVLEPLSGYLTLGARLAGGMALSGAERRRALAELCTAFNFGPDLDSNRSVRELVETILRHWPGTWIDHTRPNAPHEAEKLSLTSDRAFHRLDWRPRWGFEETIGKTVAWYRAVSAAPEAGRYAAALEATAAQIREYMDTAVR